MMLIFALLARLHTQCDRNWEIREWKLIPWCFLPVV